MHLAQLNIGRLTAPLDDPRIADFVDNLDPINALADAAPGFVWRLQDDTGNATNIQAFDDDELMIVNMSVWTSVEALADFVFRTAHVEYLRRRREFFEVPIEPITCLWRVPEGEPPTVADALARLDHLRAHGPTATAFTFRTRFTADGAPATKPRAEKDACPA